MADVAADTKNSTPMWVGLNSNLIPSSDYTQGIWHLPRINQSPMSYAIAYAVVPEILKKSLKISSECGKQNIAVTYDLAKAKLVFQIQAEESREFENIFVILGSFHIKLAYFKACEKIISESGALQIVDGSLVLAASSTNGCIKGKSCNRCQRIHELLSLTFKILHFQSYLAKIPNTEDVLNII